MLVDTLRTIGDTLASYFILVPMSRQGHTCVFSTNRPTSRERIFAYENFIAPFKSNSCERRSQTYDAKPQFAHPSSYSNERNHHFNRKEKTYYQQAISHRALNIVKYSYPLATIVVRRDTLFLSAVNQDSTSHIPIMLNPVSRIRVTLSPTSLVLRYQKGSLST